MTNYFKIGNVLEADRHVPKASLKSTARPFHRNNSRFYTHTNYKKTMNDLIDKSKANINTNIREYQQD